jgi:hypothetical protein
MELKEGLQAIIADLHIALSGMDNLQAQCQDPLWGEWLSRKCEQVSEMCQVLETMKATQPESGFDPRQHPDNGILSSKR